MPTPSSISDQVDLAIRQMVDGGLTSPKQIYTQLERLGLINEEGLPSEKAVQRRVADIRKKIDPSPWSVLDADLEEARQIAPVLRHIVAETQGRLWLSKDLAVWVAKVRAADHTLPAEWAWIFALAYQGAKLRGEEDTRCLDLALMTRAWEHPTALQSVVLRPLWPELAPLFPEPEQPSLAETCQRMGRGRQWVDLVSGQQMLDEEITGVSSFDLPPWVDDEEPPPDVAVD